MQEMKCSNCNANFLKKKKDSRYSKSFCSKQCQTAGKIKKKEVTCKNCNSSFLKYPSELSENNFCSRSCSAKFNNKGRQRNRPKKTLTIGEMHSRTSLSGKHSSWKNVSIRNLCRSWNKNLQNLPCQKCGYSKHTEFCHIKAISEFEKDTQLSVVNHPDNILVLCRNCHWEFDNKILSLDDIPKR
jgi:hypothetical protein